MAERSHDEDQSPELARLPPGRHGLPREFVVSNQRGRLAAGTIAAVVEHGYHETTVTQIVQAAGVSRRTFYQYFGSKEECFVDTYRVVEDFLLGEMRDAGEDADCFDLLGARLGAGLEVFAANPDLALFLIAAPQSAGGEVLEHYRSLLGKLRELLKEGMDLERASHDPGPAVDDGLAGGIASLIVGAVRQGEGESLTARRDEIAELVLAPYLGRQAAAAAARQLAL
ncbi:MAG TPA: TetR/AcrR family transcriptional regulator [Solirubrobacterales bacterium]|nr:TetR/AcrR family transcriptional regulator [Solirubrobacterales bacterium]